MCNDYGNRIAYSAYVEEFSHQKIPVLRPEAGAIPNLEPRDEIWPSEVAPVVRAFENGVEIVQLPWGLAPGRPKAPLVINMRSEGRNFLNGRCLVPASHFFEFTGRKSPKTRWRFTLKEHDWFCFAGLIGRAPAKEGEAGAAFTLLTCAPGPDTAPYHDRQPVVLPRERWAAWLDPSVPAGEVLGPLPAGSLEVREDPRPPKGDLFSD
jgi:putative SOS response-associated peptidase YedK